MTDEHGQCGLRVAVLMPSMARGYYWQPILREFTRRFPRTLVLTGRWDGFLPDYEGTSNIRQLTGFRFITWKRSNTGDEVGFGLLPPSLLWILMKFRPAVIISASFTLWTLCALIVKALTRCPVIVEWEGSAPSVDFLDSPVRLTIRRIMARSVNQFYSNTREGLEYLRNVIGVPPSKLLLMRVQVPDIAAMSSAPGRASDLDGLSRPTFLFIGSLMKRKGPRYLIAAAHRLKERGCGDFSIVLLGSGDETEELRRLARSSGVERHVRFVGSVPYERLGFYFRGCDVFVLPTLEDTWGMVVLEALSFGKPVLCSKYAGTKEMIEPGVNGFIFDPRDTAELAQYMEQFICNPCLADEFGDHAARTMASYTPWHSGEMYEAVIARALGKGMAPEPNSAASTSPSSVGGSTREELSSSYFDRKNGACS
jgi:glycosyltransferase involved in cell wall biosynthesis